MNLLEWQGWIMIILEAGVLWILIKEFNYDAEKYERQKQRKKRKFEFDHLTVGEGR